MEGSIGSDGLYEGKFSLGGALIDGKVAGRFAVGYSQFDGTFDNGFGYENLGGYDKKLGAVVQLSFTPTDFTTIDVFGYHGEQELDPQAGYIPLNDCGVPTTPTFTPILAAARPVRSSAASFSPRTAISSPASRRTVNSTPISCTCRRSMISAHSR